MKPASLRHASVAAVVAAAVTSCSPGYVLDGSPVPTPPYTGEVHVELAFTDSFDVFTNGSCRGRGTNGAIVDGTTVTIRRTGAPSTAPRVTTTISARYENDSDHRRDPYDDGQYCIASFTFMTPEPSFSSFTIRFESNSTYGYKEREIGPVVGEYYTSINQTCEDYDAPPEQICGPYSR